jgi:hypothetical protein
MTWVIILASFFLYCANLSPNLLHHYEFDKHTKHTHTKWLWVNYLVTSFKPLLRNFNVNSLWSCQINQNSFSCSAATHKVLSNIYTVTPHDLHITFANCTCQVPRHVQEPLSFTLSCMHDFFSGKVHATIMCENCTCKVSTVINQALSHLHDHACTRFISCQSACNPIHLNFCIEENHILFPPQRARVSTS